MQTPLTTEQIFRMAQEAGIRLASQSDTIDPRNVYLHELERFANLVAASARESMKSEGWRACAVGQRMTQHCGLLETAVLVEREACARLAEDHATGIHGHDKHGYAAAIRARGNNANATNN